MVEYDSIIFTGFSGHNSATIRRPAGAYKIASVLRQNGYNPLVVDDCTLLTLKGYKRIRDLYIGKHTKFIGFSTSFLVSEVNHPDYMQAVTDGEQYFVSRYFLSTTPDGNHNPCCYSNSFMEEIIRILRGNLEIPIIFGGSRFNIYNNITRLSLPDIHYFIGTDERALLTFLSEKYEGDIKGKDVENNLTDFKNSTIEYTDMDNILPNEWMPLEVSRGCAFNCAFCRYEHKGKKDYNKHPETLYKELIANYENFGITSYTLLDDLYNDDFSKVEMYYDRVFSRLPFKFEFLGYIRLDLMWNNREMRDLLLKSGLRAAHFGIETFHDLAGKSVGKGLGKERIMSTLRDIKVEWEDEVIKKVSMIMGLPEEPLDSIIESVNFLQETDLIDNYSWRPLSINFTDILEDENRTSKIDLNPDKYGYKRSERILNNNNMLWTNKLGLTYEELLLLSRKAHNDMPFRKQINAWAYPTTRLLGNHEVITKLWRDNDFAEKGHFAIKELNQKNKNNYLTKILCL